MGIENISVIVLKQVLLVTIPADPDDDTISYIQQRVLDKMQQTDAQGLILDISTAEILDSYFARMIVETAQMVQIMGGRTVVAGMRPAVAMTATELGLVLSNLETSLDIDSAFDMLAGGHEVTATNDIKPVQG
ncbi:MAG: STAS domain-containing protein [Sedimenticola sp.]